MCSRMRRVRVTDPASENSQLRSACTFRQEVRRKTAMKIFNTLTMTKQEFVPLKEGKVSMYVCGPTVYNLIHIGNARPMIVFDTFRRYLMHRGYEVNYVSNFTDVDDKIIKAAIEEGTTSEEIAKRYIEECKKDMAAMNVMPATTHPLATGEIDGMIEMISELIRAGHAYEKNGTVYFSTRSFRDYGELSHKNLDDLRSGFRDLKVSGEDEKEDPLDFVLWKPKKEGEPFWESPWSDGRPGWHIECSVMAKRYLGDTIDIHAGGEDLIFPHHENEIAQSTCASRTTKMKSRSPPAQMASPLPTTGCTTRSSTSTTRRCRSRSATSLPSGTSRSSMTSWSCVSSC